MPNPSKAPRKKIKPLKGSTRRYPTDAERVELVNLYHLARTAGKEKRYDRLQWAVDNFVREHPDWSHASAYKSVEQATAQPRF